MSAINDGGADALTPDQSRWLSGRLWCELTSTTYPPLTKNVWWDLPLNPKRKQSKSVGVTCGRCNGAGAIASFSIRYSGKCFACNGSGVRYISRAAFERLNAISRAKGAA